MFIGRKTELDDLDRLYRSDKFQCVILYGRRRIGKTALINEFIRDKEAIYFVGQEINARENLEGFSQSIFKLSHDFPDVSPVFSSFKESIEAVFRIAEKRRISLVIDEYPYLASSYKGISSLLQTYIDRFKETSKLFIILCGSSLSFMENQVLGYQSPLYGRRTAQIKLLPFEFRQATDFFGGKFSYEEAAVLYGITGGVPLYMSLVDRELSVAENIKAHFLSPSGYLFEEPGNLIKQECREPAQYNAIIKAVANGATRLSEIAGKVGLETSLCSTYITKLISIGIIKKEHPFKEETGRKTIYRLDDSMFRFWYRFIPDTMSLIQRREPNMAYERINDQIPAFMGAVFEEICLQHLWHLNKENQTPVRFTNAGRWWGTDPERKIESEIDIIADEKNDAIFAECKWIGKFVGVEVLDSLVERSERFQYGNKFYYLFAKSGFTETLTKKADRLGKITLIKFEEFDR